ncbi:hypothetical protein PFISCL1PPCAC_16567, partial [Pristionchus fissidentatus]
VAQMLSTLLETTAAADETAASGMETDPQARCVACNSTERVSIHYNAMSCHGCKAFFRRTVFERRKYCCSAEGRCEITDENRNQCRACRFQKCVKGGMNPKHVREERAKRRAGDSEHEYGDPPKIVLVEEHSLTTQLMDLERAMDSGLRSERAELRRRVKEQFAIPDIDMATNWNCERIMNDADLTNSYYLAFLMLSEWAGDIPEFRTLPQADQMLLFRQNFMIFGWMHFVYRAVILRQERVGVPLGNGSYVPYREEERNMMELKWQRTYGVLAKKLVEMVGIPMAEMDVDYEEYCILKTMSLFQFDNQLSEEGQRSVMQYRDQLLNALIAHIERRYPLMTATQRSQRSVKLTLLFPSLMAILDEMVRGCSIDPFWHFELRCLPTPTTSSSSPLVVSSDADVLMPTPSPSLIYSPSLTPLLVPSPAPPVVPASQEALMAQLLSQIGHLEAQYVQQLSTKMSAQNTVTAILTSTAGVSPSRPAAAVPSSSPSLLVAEGASTTTPPLTYTWDDSVQKSLNNFTHFLDTVPKQL